MWKLRHSAFGYHKPPTPPYVFWCYGLSWDEISMLEEDRKLPVERIAELLEMLVEGEPRLPSAEEIVSWDLDPEAFDGWERTFPKKRRHLTWLFRTAVRLGEDLVCWL